MPNKQGSIRKQDLMDKLTEVVQSGQILGVTTAQLAKKFNTRHHTIAKYLEYIYQNTPPEDINHTRVKIQVMFDKVFREVQHMVATAQTPTDKRQAIDLMLRCLDRFTDFLERFGIKAKAQENFHIEGEIDHNFQVTVVRREKLISVEDDG